MTDEDFEAQAAVASAAGYQFPHEMLDSDLCLDFVAMVRGEFVAWLRIGSTLRGWKALAANLIGNLHLGVTHWTAKKGKP